MREILRAVARFLREKVGWQGLGLAVGFAVIAVASAVLYRLLSDIEPREVVDALKGAEVKNVVIAALLVAAAYLTLTFYDYFALRTIGRPEISYRTAALAAFTSYSIGHNVGFSIFSGGTVRYRIYSPSGLNVFEVAKVCFVAGLTFWLGNLAVLGLGLLIAPEAASAIDQLPPLVNRGLGAAALTGLVSYVIWVSLAPRHIGRGSWDVRFPTGHLTLVQILIGIVDLGFCAAAMYVLMPATPEIDFIWLAVIFVSATLLGFASHSPGGLGVFDAAMLVGLMNFDKEDLLASLLIFRLLYYIIPFALALAIVGIRESVLGIKPLLQGIDPSHTATGPLRSELAARTKLAAPVASPVSGKRDDSGKKSTVA